MKQSLEKLQKFFTLEAGRDYDNKAVMGGLASMLEPWQTAGRFQFQKNKIEKYLFSNSPFRPVLFADVQLFTSSSFSCIP